MVYVCRNPRDTLVSWFHHVQNMESSFGFTGEFSDIAKEFMEGRVFFSDYWAHLRASINFLWLVFWHTYDSQGVREFIPYPPT